MIINFYKAGTSTSGNRGHAGLPGRRGGSAPTRNIVNAGKLTIKANSKLASQLDSALRKKGSDYNDIQNIMYSAGLTPEKIESILTEQQGFNGASQLTTDKTKVETMIQETRVISKFDLFNAREKREEELQSQVEAIEKAHLLTNSDLSNLKSKEWKEKKVELVLISSSATAYAIMNGYDAIDTVGRISPLNNTKTLEFDHRSYLASEKSKNDLEQQELLSNNITSYINSGELGEDRILNSHAARQYVEGYGNLQNATKNTTDFLLTESGFGYQPIIEHSSTFIDSMTDKEQLLFRGVDSGSVSIEKMHNDFENEQITSDSWRPTGVAGKGYYASRLERAAEYADGKTSYNDSYTTSDSHQRLDKRDNYNHGKIKYDGFDADNTPEQRIHAFKIDKSKMMDIATFSRTQREYMGKLTDRYNGSPSGSKEQRKAGLLLSLASEPYSFAMMMGVDGLYMSDNMYGEPPHFVIYNRTAIKTTRLNYLMDYNNVADLNKKSYFDFGDGSWN